ncbi:MAG: hypothetical protein KAW17_08315 [Candidatus Eisenbacteria sp.]|nr:hypothetical protein [Candidatus Eisenbacteria bacterium]
MSDPVEVRLRQRQGQIHFAERPETGFRTGDRGTHTSRTIMLAELSLLLSCCPQTATRDDYLRAILEDNCLSKRTVATRRLSSQRLSELYALDPNVRLFWIMRQCWYADSAGRPLLAILLALARDPLLKVTAPAILKMQAGEELARQQLKDALSQSVGGRLNESTLDKVVRNVASSWTQSGHLKGRGRKIRQRVDPTAVATAYALCVGFLEGSRGPALLRTLWAEVLDAPTGVLEDLAIDAKRLGLLEISKSGAVIEMAFSRFLALDERR